MQQISFNPLDRGNLNQIQQRYNIENQRKCFNPLDRGNLNQIIDGEDEQVVAASEFQSPRSGKFESNLQAGKSAIPYATLFLFQSPRSGKFESNEVIELLPRAMYSDVSIP